MINSLQSKLHRLEALRSENEEDAHPSFVRIEAASRAACPYGSSCPCGDVPCDAATAGPSLGSMLIPAWVLLAFAIGWSLAYWSSL